MAIAMAKYPVLAIFHLQKQLSQRLQRQISNGTVAIYQPPLQRKSTAPLEAVATAISNYLFTYIKSQFRFKAVYENPVLINLQFPLNFRILNNTQYGLPYNGILNILSFYMKGSASAGMAVN